MASSGSESDSSKAYRALVVQMRENERKMYSRMLRFFNFDVDQVANGREAIELFADGEEYDLMLIDNRMPIIDGLQAIRHIRSVDDGEVKIVGTSEIQGDRIPFLQAGADFFMIKPLTFSSLFMVLARLSFLH